MAQRVNESGCAREKGETGERSFHEDENDANEEEMTVYSVISLKIDREKKEEVRV